MKMSLLAALSAASLLALAAPAVADPIDGTWKSDLANAKLSEKPDILALSKGGDYECATCVPPLKIKADGKIHKVTGQDYADEASVTIVDDNNVTYVMRRGGKEVATSMDTVSADLQTLTSVTKITATPNGTPIEETKTYRRLEPGKPGQHALSGSWKRASVASSEAGMNQTFMLDGDTLKLTTPTGESYAAKLGGSEVPMVGDPAKTMVKVSRSADGTYTEEGSRNGKPLYVMTFKPSADGKTMAVSSTNKRSNTTTSFTAMKQ